MLRYLYVMDIICLLALLVGLVFNRLTDPKKAKAYRAEIFVVSIEEKEVKTNGTNSNRRTES
jgi:hypothetical protein